MWEVHSPAPCRLLSLEITFSAAEDAVQVGSSTSYEIQQPNVRCATAKLDSALENSFSSLLMANRALTLPLVTFHTQSQFIPAGDIEINVSLVRAFNRLNAAFVSFTGSQAADTPPANKQTVVSYLNLSAIIVGGGGAHDVHHMEWDMQLGSSKFPETPCSSFGERFSLLRQATNVYDEWIRTLSMTTQSYGPLGFVRGVPMMSVLGAPFSGTGSRSGDLLTFRTKKNIG